MLYDGGADYGIEFMIIEMDPRTAYKLHSWRTQTGNGPQSCGTYLKTYQIPEPERIQGPQDAPASTSGREHAGRSRHMDQGFYGGRISDPFACQRYLAKNACGIIPRFPQPR